jgi:hypothetical protein
MANQLAMDKSLAINNLRNAGYSERRIAKTLGVSRGAVRRHLTSESSNSTKASTTHGFWDDTNVIRSGNDYHSSPQFAWLRKSSLLEDLFNDRQGGDQEACRGRYDPSESYQRLRRSSPQTLCPKAWFCETMHLGIAGSILASSVGVQTVDNRYRASFLFEM